jgi:hypothetical protein
VLSTASGKMLASGQRRVLAAAACRAAAAGSAPRAGAGVGAGARATVAILSRSAFSTSSHGPVGARWLSAKGASAGKGAGGDGKKGKVGKVKKDKAAPAATAADKLHKTLVREVELVHEARPDPLLPPEVYGLGFGLGYSSRIRTGP